MNILEYELTGQQELEMSEWLTETRTRPGMKIRIDSRNPSLLELTVLWTKL
jgi:hypothetical protein